MNNILNAFSTFLQSSQTSQNTANNLSSPTNNLSQNNTSSYKSPSPPSDYPDVFFTSNPKTQIQSINQPNNINEQTNNQSFSSSYANQQPTQIFELLKAILPLLSKKNSKLDMGSLLGNFNPQLSNVLSIFSSKKNKDKKETPPSAPNEKLIDLSNYTKTN